jgi:predicted Fe-Mo cluster-binding NifX family protein
MRLALSIWKHRLSPVLDVASRLLVVSLKEGREQYRFEADIVDLSISRICRLLKDLQVDALICGAISQDYLVALRDSGIDVTPEMAGEVDAILNAFLNGALMQPKFFLPGR